MTTRAVPARSHHPVVLTGEHDISTADDVALSLADAIADDEQVVGVDLSELSFMDASTVNVLLRAQRYLAERSRHLEVRRPSAAARRVLEACGLTSWISADHPSDRPWAS